MRVAVFTGSADGPEGHRRAAAAFARELATGGVGIVYGGGRVGLMGVVADAALAAGGEVIGVLPQHLVDGEIAHPGLTRLEVVVDMHERKARMAALADAFVALPGGAGTLEELFEVWTWGQLGLHAKPAALLDPDDFWSPLRSQLDAMTAAGYLAPAYRDCLGHVTSAAEFTDWVSAYRHPAGKWRAAVHELTSVGWVHERGGRLLAVRSRGRDRFYLPGGKLEAGETREDALRREVGEELGVALGRLDAAFTVSAEAHGQPDRTRLTMHCFTGELVGEPVAQGEIEEVAWLDGPDDPRAAPAVREVLLRLAGRRPA